MLEKHVLEFLTATWVNAGRTHLLQQVQVELSSMSGIMEIRFTGGESFAKSLLSLD